MNSPPGRPTKADLAAAVERLTAENAALRDLIAAVAEHARAGHETHGKDYRHWHPGWLAATHIAIWLDAIDTMGSPAATAALFRREVAEITALGEPPAPEAVLAELGACADCGHLVCDCDADMGEDPTDSIAEGHDADYPDVSGGGVPYLPAPTSFVAPSSPRLRGAEIIVRNGVEYAAPAGGAE